MLRGTRQITNRQTDRIVTGPASEPVTLTELKLHLRETGSDQDDYLTDSIIAAREEIESVSGFAFIDQTWTLLLDRWPGQREAWWDGVRVGSINALYGGFGDLTNITPSRYPLQTVDTLTVYSDVGTSASVTVADVFDVDATSWPGRINIKRGAVWPIALRSINAIEFGYTSGFGADADAVPEQYKRAIRSMAAWIYENRGTGCSRGDAYIDSGASSIIAKFKQVRL